ncbi:MAG: beta-lactamase family protein [Acidobacteria bacterium]|nr:beta-lactamase family protein [Acidobacteriota bacterium]
MKKIASLVLLGVALLPAAPPIVEASKAGMDADRLARLSARMKEYVDRGELAGVVTLVSRHGVTAALDAHGWADVAGKKQMKPDSIFQIMSMTKPVCGTAIMMLVEEGKLALTDPVEKHLPEFRGQMMVAYRDKDTVTLKKPSRPITVRDLMTHTSGIAGAPQAGIGELYQKMHLTLAEAVHFYSQLPLNFEPGTEWQYSNTGIATLGRLVEVASGMPFEKFLETRLFQPLGMKDSFIFPPADKVDRIVIVHQAKDGKLVDAPPTILGGDSRLHRKGAKYSAPEFGLHSTAQDLAAFYNMMRAGGVHQGKRLLTSASVKVATSLHTADIRAGHLPGTGFGLTWEVTRVPLGTLNLMSVGSFGHGGAFGTHGWIDPEKDLVGVFLIQHTGSSTNAKQVFMGMAAAAINE